MIFEIHIIGDRAIGELVAAGVVINGVEDGLDLLGNAYHQRFEKLIVHERNLTPDFFDLKTGIAGEILQKFSNYRIRLAIVGDFAKYSSKSLRDFIFESNKGGRVNFVGSVEEAVVVLGR